MALDEPDERTVPMTAAEPEQRAVFSAASAVLITHPDDEELVLLVRHGRSGLYVLPGGKVQSGETPREAAEREGREETGVPVRAGALLVMNWMTARAELWPGAAALPSAYPCTLTTFEATVEALDAERIRVPAGEILGYAWWTVDQAAQEGRMEHYNLINLRAATRARRQRSGAVYLES